MKRVKFVAIALTLVMLIALFSGCVKQADLDAVQSKLDAANAELATAKADLTKAKGDLTASQKTASELQAVIDGSYLYSKDPFTNASENVRFPQYDWGVTPATVCAAVNSYNYSGTYLLITTNPDGSPNAGFLIYGMKEFDGKYYLTIGFDTENADKTNQTGLNALREGRMVAIWAANNDNSTIPVENQKAFCTMGIKMQCELRDEIKESLGLSDHGTYVSHVFEIIDYAPIG